MKVIILHRNSFDVIGGVESTIYYMAKELNNLGFEAIVVAKKRSDSVQQDNNNFCKVIRYKPSRYLKKATVLFHPYLEYKNAFKDLKIRVVNVVDLMRLQPDFQHPHGLSNQDYNAIFTKDKPIIFAFHGYPSLIHQLIYKRENKDIHVHGYKEEGTITTPFDMRVQNEIDRYHIVIDALKYLPQLGNSSSRLIEWCKDKLIEHSEYIREYGQDLEEVRNWTWEDSMKEIDK